MDKNLIVERNALPANVLEWLEADEKREGVLFYREENGRVVLERMENVDSAMLARGRENIQRYPSTLERLVTS